MFLRLFVTAAVLALSSTAGWAERGPDEEASRIYSYCFKGGASMAQGRDCLAKQNTRLSRQLSAAIRQKEFKIGEVATRPSDGEPPYGADTAQRWKAAFEKEQAAWVTYSSLACQALAEFGSGTAGAEDDASLCLIRASLRRIADLR